MIEPSRLYRLVASIVKAAPANGGTQGVVDIAKHLGLDLEDTATLLRVASGEG